MKIKVLYIVLFVFTFGTAQEKMMNDNNFKFQEHFFEALSQKATNNPKKAIENLEICYQIDSANAAVKFELSKNYFQTKDYSNAKVFVDKALYSKPFNLFLQQHKVEILKAQNRFKEAIKIQQKIIKNYPVYTEDLVLLYIQNKEYEKANYLVTEAENNGLITSRIISYKKYLKNVLDAKNNAKIDKNFTVNTSLKELQKAFKASKKYITLIKLLEKEKQLNKFRLLLKDTKEGLDFFPTQPKLYKIQGMAYNKLNEPKKAIETLLIGIDFVIDNIMLVDFYKELLISYKALNNKAKMVEIQNKLKKIKNSK